MILDEIKLKLEEIDKCVYYGAVSKSIKETEWNYIVFNRAPTKINQNKNGYSYYFSVNIVRENFVPEGLDLEVISKVEEISGMKLANTDMEYNYIVKPNTNIVVEMLTINFVKAMKV